MLGDFACGCYRFVLEAATPLWLSAFAGATLRGGFGHVFKRSVCVWPPGDCSRCLLKQVCSYPYIFETAPPPGSAKLRGLDQIPRPYVIEPPEGDRRYRPGERVEFRLVLVGRALEYLPYFVFTFCELGRVGLGPDRGQYLVAEVHAEGLGDTERIYAAHDGQLLGPGPRVTGAALAEQYRAAEGEQLTVRFVTPTRIRQDGVVQTEIHFQDLIRALLRRLSSLCYFHCGQELDVDFRCLIERAGAVRTVASSLRWHGQERFSGKQKRAVEMGGVVGDVTFAVPDAESRAAFWPLLAVGEWVHVGKGAVMGLGKYQMEER